MRLRLGRPRLTDYAHLLTVPPAVERSPFAATFLGVSTLLLDDGTSAILTDGFFSRPGLLRVAAGRIEPDQTRIGTALTRAGIDRLDAVLPVHTHFDHALDSAVVAETTGALLVGGESVANIGRGHGLPESRIEVVTSGVPQQFGNWEITHLASEHCPPDRYPGTIDAPVVPPVRTTAYRCGEAWSILVRHSSGRRLLVQGSAGFVPGSLAGQQAEVAWLGIGQLGVQPEQYLRDYWTETVRTVGARHVVLTHWDDFFSALPDEHAGLRALPYAGDDLDVTMRVFRELAAADGVSLHLPRLWQREDPWLLDHLSAPGDPAR
ncbi:MBL fold metallo-hydrolase [Nocardioides sp. Bht2]|uniref:MBL fold metallo-hydrolase n=1 Tax=Nocardioides sp. Bht2 TaxID=3392297 RepID=UPI0039B499E4